jgi:hypothetical protein
VKIWPFVWKFDFYWTFVWNMLNVWKYGHLCENMTFIEYLCEICSMCDNMAIWCLGSVSEVCAVSEVLCSISDGHYTKSGNSSVSGEEKGWRAHETHISYLRRRETCPCNARHLSGEKGDVLTKCTSPFYLTCTKKEYLQIILHRMPLTPARIMPIDTHMWTYVGQWASWGPSSRSTAWITSCLTSSKPLDHRGFKSWWALLLVGEVGLNF